MHCIPIVISLCWYTCWTVFILVGLVWDLIIVLSCIFVMNSGVEHLFTYLLAICISSLRNIQALCPFLNHTHFFSGLGNLYIFWMLTPLSHKWFANILPHFVCYLFTQLIVFWYTEHFSFHEVLFVCFYFCYLCLSYHIQEITVKSVLWNFCPMFSSKGCIVWGFTFRSLIHLKLILYMVLGKCLISFFCMWMFSFPSNICWKYCPFCIEMSWHLCQASFDHYVKVHFLGCLFYCFGLYVCLYASIRGLITVVL